MKNITIEDIKNAEKKLLPCPFCGVKPQIIICDDEGNIKRNPEEYLEEQWSGLSFSLIHPKDEKHFCPVATEKDDDIVLGNYLYDSLDEIIEKWNKRFNNTPVKKSWFDDVSQVCLTFSKYGKKIEYGKQIDITYMFNHRLIYLKNVSFSDAITALREEFKGGEYDIRFIFKNGEIKDYKI